jgi:hypothetical protein
MVDSAPRPRKAPPSVSGPKTISNVLAEERPFLSARIGIAMIGPGVRRGRQNLWGDLPTGKNVRTPHSMMLEQANLLTKETRGRRSARTSQLRAKPNLRSG